MSDRIEKLAKEYGAGKGQAAAVHIAMAMPELPPAVTAAVAALIEEFTVGGVRFGVTLGRAEALTTRPPIEGEA